MNWYAMEQLARQRGDQFATEARGDLQVRLARHAPGTSEPSVGPSSHYRVARLLNRLGAATLVRAARRLRQPRRAEESIDRRAVGSRNA